MPQFRRRPGPAAPVTLTFSPQMVSVLYLRDRFGLGYASDVPALRDGPARTTRTLPERAAAALVGLWDAERSAPGSTGNDPRWHTVYTDRAEFDPDHEQGRWELEHHPVMIKQMADFVARRTRTVEDEPQVAGAFAAAISCGLVSIVLLPVNGQYHTWVPAKRNADRHRSDAQ